MVQLGAFNNYLIRILEATHFEKMEKIRTIAKALTWDHGLKWQDPLSSFQIPQFQCMPAPVFEQSLTASCFHQV